MERSIILQGTKRNRSYTLTLPSEWVRNNKLEDSLRVDLEVIDNRTIIKPQTEKKQEIVIDAAGLSHILKKMIVEKYKSGVDEIRIRFEKRETMDTIRAVVEKELIGFEIFDHSKNSCLIRDISKETIESFEQSLRRSFLFLLDIANEVNEAIKKNDLEELQRITSMDTDLNKLVYFCERQLNKRSLDYHGKMQFYFFLLERMENIGDNYRGICTLMLEHKKKMSEKTLKVILEITSCLRDFYEIYYSNKFEIKLVNFLYERLRKTRQSMLALYNTKTDTRYLYYIGGLFQMNMGMIRALFVLRE